MRSIRIAIAVLFFGLAAVTLGAAQTISPLISELRGKGQAQGMFELRNDSEEAMAVILEVAGFSVDENGTFLYIEPPAGTQVDFGSNSFVIPPHQNHMVFFKVSTTQPSTWFSIRSTMTKAKAEPNRMRINYVLPHIVYLYQKTKLKQDDVNVQVRPTGDGEMLLEVTNRSQKLARVEGIASKGFASNVEVGGFPVFPGKTRFVQLKTGAASGPDADIRVSFEDGFSVRVPVSK